jgi:hypothetical protein
MRKFLYAKLFAFALVSLQLTAQNIAYERFNLDPSLSEISGLGVFRSRLIAHNDSGNDPVIFEIGAPPELLLNSFRLEGVENIDWEDIATDEDYLYIADVGNNYGSRTDLRILKFTEGLVLIDSINLVYKNQRSFERNYNTPFDCEAIISYGSDLILFSKNKKDSLSNIYRVAKSSEEILLKPVDSVFFGSLITGADYNYEMNLLALCGYSMDIDVQYLYLIPDFSIPIDVQKIVRISLPYDNAQVESVIIVSNNELIMASENEGNGNPFLIKVKFPTGLFNDQGLFNFEL